MAYGHKKMRAEPGSLFKIDLLEALALFPALALVYQDIIFRPRSQQITVQFFDIFDISNDKSKPCAIR
jgi:hypothetical protein